MIDDVREFRFQRVGISSGLWTFMSVVFTVYFLWGIYQAIAGIQPPWVIPIAVLVIVYMWYMRLGSVETMTVAGDGRVNFIRGWGRREVEAIDIEAVRPWLNISRRNFVLKHARGFELLFEDPAQTARVVRELLRLNPELTVRGVPLGPDETL